MIYTHTSPRQSKRKDKIRDEIEAWNVFEETDRRLVFVGDVHIPFIYGQNCSRKVSATVHPITYGKDFLFQPDDRYLVCPGAAGYSRDALPEPRYAIYDDVKMSVTFERVMAQEA